MPRIALLAPLFLLALAPGLRAETASFKDTERAFDAALKSDDPDVRAKAYDQLTTSTDPRTVDLIVKSLKKIRDEQEKIRKEQASLEKSYEQEFNDKLDAEAEFERSNKSGRALDRFNERVRKISRNLDRLHLQQKTLENEFTRTRALMDGAVNAMTKVLSNLAPDDLVPALDRVAQGWLDSREVEDRLRWVYALEDLPGDQIDFRLATEARNPERDLKVRAAALEALGTRKNANAFHIAESFLKDKATPWDLVTASIEALRRLHEKRSIPVLIEFLAREDLARGREDAHQALKSLTGEKHGPYAQPWRDWWKENQDRWAMPPTPVKDDKNDRPQEKGVTFYGITTFSKRIMFILDISGSMELAPMEKDELGRDVPSGPPKIETAKQELIGAINNVEDDAIFNLIFFNHEVVMWQPRMQEGSESKKRRAIKWVEEQKPLGTTNIHDALEEAYQIALAATGETLIDTIFFMTDGRPTSGKVRDPKEILKEVLEWNKVARIRIHTVGVGDHDEELLKGLADETGGTYVKR